MKSKIRFFFFVCCITLFCSTVSGQSTLPQTNGLTVVKSAGSYLKKTILQKAIGTYPLTYIGGFAGANAMFDTENEKGKWKSSGSAIEMGMREMYYNDLTQDDLDLLNSTYIKLDSALTIYLMMGKQELIKSEYVEDGMDYRITDTTEASLIGFLKDDMLGGVNSSTIFYYKTILLVADEKVDFEDEFKGNFSAVLSDHLLLTYDIEKKCFNIEIFEGQCCSNGNMLFKKED